MTRSARSQYVYASILGEAPASLRATRDIIGAAERVGASKTPREYSTAAEQRAIAAHGVSATRVSGRVAFPLSGMRW